MISARTGPRLLIMAAPMILVIIMAAALYQSYAIYRADAVFASAQFAPGPVVVEALRSAARMSPENETYLLTLAAREASTDPARAEKLAQRAGEASPHSYVPHQFLAQLYLTDGRELPQSRLRARAAVREALLLFPNSPALRALKRSAYGGDQ